MAADDAGLLTVAREADKPGIDRVGQVEHVDLTVERQLHHGRAEGRAQPPAQGDIALADHPHALKIIRRGEQFLNADDGLGVRVFKQVADHALFVGKGPVKARARDPRRLADVLDGDLVIIPQTKAAHGRLCNSAPKL